MEIRSFSTPHNKKAKKTEMTTDLNNFNKYTTLQMSHYSWERPMLGYFKELKNWSLIPSGLKSLNQLLLPSFAYYYLKLITL